MTDLDHNQPYRAGISFRFLISKLEGILLVVWIIILVASVLLGILSRYLPLEVVFATEVSKYSFIWLCAIGISAAARDNQHVRLTVIVDYLPINRQITWIISQILFLFFAGFLFYWGTQLTIMHWEMGKSAMGFQFPMFLFTAALPLGMGLTAVRLVQNILMSMNPPPGKLPWETESTGLGGITEETK